MTTFNMVPRLHTPQVGTLARENKLVTSGGSTSGGLYASTRKLNHSFELLDTGCKDVEKNNVRPDWQDWIASVQVRNRTRAFYMPCRRRNGKEESWHGDGETARGRSCFVWQKKMCSGLLSRSIGKRFFYKMMFSIYNESKMDRNLGGVDEVLAPSYAEKLSKSAVSRLSLCSVGSAEWYAALKERLNITVRFCVSKQRQLDRSSVVRDVEGVVLPSLTPAMVHEVEAALVPTPPDEVLASAFRLNISRADMHTLTDTQWLNDEVVNFYMNLLMQRSQKEGFPTVYAFNTFFYPKLVQGGHAALKRWTRTVDLFSFDIILVPLHLTAHWCLAVVDFRKPHIAYYDSLNSDCEQPQCLATLQKYLEDESLHKRSYGLNWDCWTLKVMDVPQQENYNDCGMFTCQFAECISRDAPISFGQQHMPYFRKRVVYEILHKTILSV